MLDELRADLGALLDDALADLAGEREPLQAERIACLVALPAGEVQGAHDVIVSELEARGGPEAADLLAVMARLHPEPLRSAAAAAAERVGGARPAPAIEVGRIVRVQDEGASMLAAAVEADGGSFALTVISDELGLSGGLGQPGTWDEVADALDEVPDAEDLHPAVAAAALRSLLEEAARTRTHADEGLTLDGPIVVHAFGLPAETWPDLPLMVTPDAEMPAEEPARAVPPRPPADAARKKAKRRSQKNARKRNR